jgi:IMP dehydrogenase
MVVRKELALTFDDVLLVPQYSRIASRQDVQPRSKLVPGLELKIPILSANMDTVTEAQMAIAMARAGGMGVIHRFMSVEHQAEEIVKVKRSESFMVEEPASIQPEATLAEAKELMGEANIGGLVVVDAAGYVVGMLTRRDLLFAPDPADPVSKAMTPRSELVVVSASVNLEAARQKLHEHRIEKLPLVDEAGYLKGLITAQDIVKIAQYPGATKDSKGQLRVGAAIGARDSDLERAQACISAGADVLVVDIAHGHSENCLEMVRRLKSRVADIPVVAGNVATPAGVRDLAEAGADAVKVGIGAGSICVTRQVTGFGVPQLSAILQCAPTAHECKVPLIADGGIRNSADVVKALAAGASSVMIGSLFAGTDEAPGATVIRDGQKVKVVRGMASLTANLERHLLEQGHELEPGDWVRVVPEGIEAIVPYRGSVEDVLYQLIGGVRSGMSYAGAESIEELWEHAEFIRITRAGLRESGLHSVKPIE